MKKVNLDKVWNLPIGIGFWKYEGKYCALGLVCAAIYGEDKVPEGPTLNEFSFNISRALGEEVSVGIRFDNEMTSIRMETMYDLSKSKKKEELIREKYVRIILSKLLEVGFIELEDSELQIVKELKAASNAKQSVCS